MTDGLAALARSVIAVGFTGRTASEVPLAALRAFAPGACLLFARNVGTAHELRDMIVALRALDDVPPLIAVDQEGGRVARIGSPVAAVPAAMAIGATGDVDLCERIGVLLGRDLAALGVSVDFAPVADLALFAANTVIGTRSFGSEPHVVARFAGAFARGLERGGVAAAIKHFPGHGSTAGDSHVMLPHATADAATLQARDLVPFAAAISSDAASIVMSTHVVVDAFDPDMPATLSPRILTGLVRERYGFDGVIATDCLEMDAIAGSAGTVAGAVAALAAGADLLLVSHTLELAQSAADAIVAAVVAGRLPRARLEDAARRVRALRADVAARVPYAGPVDPGAPLAAAQRAVTVLRGDVRLRAGQAVTVISFEGRAFDGAGGVRAEQPSLSAALRARRWKSEVMRVALDPDADDLELLLAHVPALGDRNFAIVTRRAYLHPAQRAAVDRLLAIVPGAIVISANEPYDVALWPQARTIAAIYGDDALAFEGCADVMSGRATATGTLPVRVGDAALR